MTLTILLTLAGLILLLFGADSLIKGAVSLSKIWKLPEAFIGFTLVALGTSLPELFTSIMARLSEADDAVLGNVLGSNLFNGFFVLGLTCFLSPRILPISEKKGSLLSLGAFGLALAYFSAAAFTIQKLNVLWGVFSILLLIGTILFLFKQNAIDTEDTGDENSQESMPKALLFSLLGITFTILGSKVFLQGSLDLGEFFGMDASATGALILAIGTGFPELMTSIIASIKGHQSLALSNILGSNIINLLAVLGISTFLGDLAVSKAAQTDSLYNILLAICMLLFFTNSSKLIRFSGLGFVFFYFLYFYIRI